MTNGKFIGIDPDSCGFQCVLLGKELLEKTARYFQATPKGLREFHRWWADQGEPGIALEGKNGQNRHLERFLRCHSLQFYSFSAQQVARAKELFVGQHKTNRTDAQAVAHLAFSLSQEGSLEKYRSLWVPQDSLRDLTRFYQHLTKNLAEESNRLWKEIHKSSLPLYLLLSGKSPNSPYQTSTLTKGIIRLLAQLPEIWRWQEYSDEQLREVMGRKSTYRSNFIELIKQASAETEQNDPISLMVLQHTAQQVLLYMRQKTEAIQTLKGESASQPSIQRLMRIKGCGTISASGLVAEIIDIRRFPSNNHLASYSGLGRTIHATGSTWRDHAPRQFNRRLKNSFMTVAKSYLRYNPDSHLCGYFRNLIKQGMKLTEARKRVARALVRLIYRELKNCQAEESEAKQEQGGAVPANDISHCGPHPSNEINTLFEDTTERRKNLSHREQKPPNTT